MFSTCLLYTSSILDEMTPYDSDASKATTFMEHLRRSFHYTMEHLGPHNLPLIGRADSVSYTHLDVYKRQPIWQSHFYVVQQSVY